MAIKDLVSKNDINTPYEIPEKDILNVINKYLFDKGIISKKLYEDARAEILKV